MPLNNHQSLGLALDDSQRTQSAHALRMNAQLLEECQDELANTRNDSYHYSGGNSDEGDSDESDGVFLDDYGDENFRMAHDGGRFTRRRPRNAQLNIASAPNSRAPQGMTGPRPGPSSIQSAASSSSTLPAASSRPDVAAPMISRAPPTAVAARSSMHASQPTPTAPCAANGCSKSVKLTSSTGHWTCNRGRQW